MECSPRLKLKEIENYEGKLEKEILYEVAAKRFEYTYESLWKLLRLYLLELKGLECNSPMDCFKTFYDFIVRRVFPLLEKILKVVEKDCKT